MNQITKTWPYIDIWWSKHPQKWLPDDLKHYQLATNNKYRMRGTFKALPWKLLKRRDITLDDMNFLCTIGNLAKEHQKLYLSNANIIKQLGKLPRDAIRYLPKRLTKYEKLGYIIIENRQGRHRIIHITKKLSSLLGRPILDIEPAIYLLNISFSKKIVLALKRKYKEKKHTEIAKQLGISRKQVQKLIAETEEISLFLNHRPYTKSDTQPYTKGYAHSIYLKQDNASPLISIKGSAALYLDKETKVSPTPGMTSYNNLEGQRNMKQINIFQSIGKTKIKTPVIPCNEIDEVWNSFPCLQTHKPLFRGKVNKTYREAKRWIWRLENGLMGRYVRPGKLLAKMAKMGYSQNQVNQLLDKKWTREEREEVYKRLNERCGQNKRLPRDFPTIVYNPRTDSSLFLGEYLRTEEPEYSEEIRYGMKQIRELVSFNQKYSDREIANVVKEVYDFYDFIGMEGLDIIRVTNIYATCGEIYIEKLKEFIHENYIKRSLNPLEINPGWFKVDSIPHRRFLVEIFKNKGVISDPERLFGVKSIRTFFDGEEDYYYRKESWL